jgi:peptidylprolyl isomerase
MIGDTVSVYYTLTFENGTVIDTNMNGTPLVLTVGGNQIIPGFSNAIVGMRLNQKKTVTIPYDQAYGPYRSDLIRTVNRTGAIANTTFTVGQYYTIHSKTDNTISTIKILNVTPSTVTWDENSPLAGQNLTFTIQIVSVNKGNGINAAATALPTIPTTIPI